MGILSIISALFIALGAAVVLAAVARTRRVMSLVGPRRMRDWRVLRSLMSFFFFGYFVALVIVLRPLEQALGITTGVVFFFAGLFVWLVVRLGHSTLREIEERRRDLDDIVGSMRDALVVTEPDGRIRIVNEALCSLLEYGRDEIVGQPLDRILQPTPGRANRSGELVALAGRGGIQDQEMEFRLKDGRTVPVSLAGSAMRDKEERITGLVLVARDLRERLQLLQDAARVYAARDKAQELEQAYDQLESQRKELERSNAELGQFAYVASHDLQEPLRMITSYLQLLQRRYDEQLDSQAHEFIGFAVDGARRMRALILALLDYSRVDTRAKEHEPTDLNKVVAQAAGNLREATRESGAGITHDPLPTVAADEAQLVQLFQNLLSNAIKFRRDDSPQIHISVSRDDKRWIVAHRDNGIGISPEYRARIFDIFQRLHTRDEYPGTGIGLAICKKIVEIHDGEIWVESEPGEGTTFLCSFPVLEE